jgi:catechol 2,3-dioxygenase-like lactoylglutathione lyase family enzyme
MIRSLLHIGMTVPNPEVGRAFYELFGLEASFKNNDLIFRCQGRPQNQIRLIEGPRKKLAYVSFGTDADGMKSLAVRLERAGIRIEKSPFGAIDGLWFQDPHGDWVNVQLAEPEPSSLPPAAEINAPGHYRRIGTRACDAATLKTKKARPRRLGHLIKFTPDVNRSIAFYTEILGMKLSDRAYDILAFLRGASGGDHHMLAFAKSTHTGLHHLSFEVADFDEIAIGAQTLLRAGYKDGFGPGRHIGGSNYFHYIRDPWNSLAEYFWDIDIIPEDDSGWTPMNVAPEEITALWAATAPPPEFAVNFEAKD